MEMDDGMKARIKIHEAYTNYWLAMANTGAGKNRNLFHGICKHKKFTDEEKIDDCLQTALIHIHRMQDLIDEHEENVYSLKKEGLTT
jgi:hypothetical protein